MAGVGRSWGKECCFFGFFLYIYRKVSNTREESQDDKRKNGAKTELKSKKCDSGIKIDENVFG